MSETVSHNLNKEKILPRVAVGLVHYPVWDRAKKVVATNITNFDIHDIARACEVYGVERYYIIHPMQDQLMFVSRILDHWRLGDGSKFNPLRRTALNDVFPVQSVDEARRHWGIDCKMITTSARAIEGVKSYTFSGLKEEMQEGKNAYFILFGTGFGMTESLVQSCDGLLEPIRGAPPKDYRHLSVRSAVSICLDRLLGPW